MLYSYEQIPTVSRWWLVTTSSAVTRTIVFLLRSARGVHCSQSYRVDQWKFFLSLHTFVRGKKLQLIISLVSIVTPSSVFSSGSLAGLFFFKLPKLLKSKLGYRSTSVVTPLRFFNCSLVINLKIPISCYGRGMKKKYAGKVQRGVLRFYLKTSNFHRLFLGKPIGLRTYLT